MAHIAWSDDFVLGIEPFDQHHRHLIDLINATSDCLERGGASFQELDRLLGELKEYARYHFTAEEAFMAERGYPDSDSHSTLHRGFIGAIERFASRLDAGGEGVTEELAGYLDYWLIDHIVINDSLYAEHAGRPRKSSLMI